MKPDYSNWKPPFRYDSSDRTIRSGIQYPCVSVIDHRIFSNRIWTDQETNALGQRIAELLNKDAEEKGEG